jgi:RNA polymerase sigma-70 factor (ECF subfamily)
MTKTGDFELLDAWRDGDKQAGEALFDRHFDAIYRFFNSKLSHDVDDMVQRTFLACVKSRDRFRKASSFRTYLFTIARNELYGGFRNRKKNENIDFGVSSLADLSPGMPSLIGAKQEQRTLLEALRRLPLDLQIVIELHYWEHLRGPELAEVLAIPEGTVRSRIRRAHAALEAELSRLAKGSQLKSTIHNLEHWAQQLRGAFDKPK